MEWLTAWNSWLIAGFVLLILEVFLSGVFFMWWGFAAMIVAGIVSVVTISISWQFTIFAVLAIIFSFFWWRYQQKKDLEQDAASSLNRRDHAMLGKQGRVVDILDNGAIRAKFADTTWKVEGQNLAIGDSVQVTDVQGIVLMVEKLES
ncbi:NfeD family protein [Phocoenobacter skyensis]|uniref:NfeD family protein n=1 Tax=Phocoenobacter skyensis TaxID=97481 RepID=A0A1H7XEN4_9PAST|nr:NfeD family protein [Pasteurella skyensis]MDP8079666.1 NfeD family protein [Pasteurella skyensis]MDP8085634.1 NfeD family protein [Pasteurella skyensis]MDP8170581.1 NfeD family protein [Pasteurella skyensis]MDP8174592.1 NfeD family protein [Pasteurella skyensis]MDP8185383.1 NfeD family protein [Pasteurella skyensis]